MQARLPHDQLRELTRVASSSAIVRFDEPLRNHTSFGIGGPCDLLMTLGDAKDLVAVLSYCQEYQLPWFILGKGSNLLVRDGGVRMIALKLAGEFAQFVIGEQGLVLAGAAAPLAALARASAGAGWSGLGFAAGIPGSLGGGVIMNAGAYEGQMSDVVHRVEVVGPDLAGQWLDAEQLAYTYRKSTLQDEAVVVTRVELCLTKGDAPALLAAIAELENRRWRRQPLELPSAGSFFKRPQGYYAAELIEKAGLKGYRVGGAQVSSLHAGFIVNAGGATARDVLTLMHHIQTEVHQRYQVWLEPEVRIMGEDDHA